MKRQRRPFFESALIVVLIVSGCGPSAKPSSPKKKLIGHWKGVVEFDDAKVQQKLNESGGNPIKQAIANRLIAAIEKGEIRFELNEDDTFASSVKLGPLSKDVRGTWKVAQANGNRITIQLTDEKGESNRLAVVFSDDGSFTVPVEGPAGEFAVFRCRRESETE